MSSSTSALNHDFVLPIILSKLWVVWYYRITQYTYIAREYKCYLYSLVRNLRFFLLSKGLTNKFYISEQCTYLLYTYMKTQRPYDLLTYNKFATSIYDIPYILQTGIAIHFFFVKIIKLKLAKSFTVSEIEWLGLWCLTPLSTIWRKTP